MALLEEIGRQSQHVADEIADDLEAQEMTEDPQRPAAQAPRSAPGSRPARRSASASDREEILVGMEDRFVDDELDLERRRRRRRSAARPTARSPAGRRSRTPVICDQRLDRRIGARRARTRKFAVGVSSSTTPVKCFDTSASGSVRTPMAGIVDHDRAGTVTELQHDEVIEVPMQDRRRLHLGEGGKLDPQRAGGKSQAGPRAPSGFAATCPTATARSAGAGR